MLTGRFVAICLLPLQMEASECRSSSYVAPKVLFLAMDSHLSPSCDTKILIDIQIQWSNSGGSRPHSLRIFILLPVGALSSSLNALRSSSCYGWRVGNVYTHSCVTATAEDIVTLLTLLTLRTLRTLLKLGYST